MVTSGDYGGKCRLCERRPYVLQVVCYVGIYRFFVLFMADAYPSAVCVSNIDIDPINVSRVLRLDQFTHFRKIVLPASLPLLFTCLRLSLCLGWMVLFAAHLLAQNPGLGKFVWDEFQNGSSESLARIMVAVLTIGAIGFVLDRGMLSIQRWVSWDKNSALR